MTMLDRELNTLIGPIEHEYAEASDKHPGAPKVTCICPTFGRMPYEPTLLNTVIYSFMQQITSVSCELLIYNDHPLQTLYFPESANLPGRRVRIVNVKERFPTLGAKYNAMVEEARGLIILPWEDDDYSLTHRIDQAVGKLGGLYPIPSDPRFKLYFNPQKTWYQAEGALHMDHAHGVCHNASAFRKSAWRLIKMSGFSSPNGRKGYPESTGDQDALFDRELKDLCGMYKQDHHSLLAPPLFEPHEWSYVYRWGVSQLHLSGNPDMVAAYANNPTKNWRGDGLIHPVRPGLDYQRLTHYMAINKVSFKRAEEMVADVKKGRCAWCSTGPCSGECRGTSCVSRAIGE